ncbi:MAG: GAF domain-containing protein [Candidatus Omnitrophica bacterium]|nr:GAF domain-containing protein [Candidatus Omnitrophota bacterium]
MTKTISDKYENNKQALNLSSLEEISQVLGARFDLDKLYQIILDTIVKQTNADSGSLMLLAPNKNELYIAAAQGINPKLVKKIRVKLGQIVAGIVAKTKKPLLINNKNFQAIFGKKPRKNVKSSLSIPLIVVNKLIGVINLNRIPGSESFTKDDINIISKFAFESSIAIHNAKLYIEAEEKIQHLFRFNVISCALNAALTEDKMINVLTDCMRELFNFDLYTLLVISDDSTSLTLCSQNKIDNRTINKLKKDLNLVIRGLKKTKFSTKDIELNLIKIKNHRQKVKHPILPKHIREVINAPIITKGNTLGMLSIYSIEEHGFDQKDQQSLSTLANQAAVALENAHLYKSLRTTYLSTIKALAQAIEEKDVYTRGHSDLVSYYSVAIAEALQLPPKLIEGIQIAGILHDIGKIGIPEEILSKPGSLTKSEYEIIMKHPTIGRRILGPVNFYWADLTADADKKSRRKKRTIIVDPKIIQQIQGSLNTTLSILKEMNLSEEIKSMIYHHHEKYSGGGYPTGIKKEEIPIGARILAVADTFEAMTADRPYRKAFSTKKALRLINECSPFQLDPKIVDIFTRLVKQKCVIVNKATLTQ